MELKYKEAQRRIIAMVAMKDYDVGTKFPDEIELSQKIGFSGITIRRALKELEKTGLISASPRTWNYIKTEKYLSLQIWKLCYLYKPTQRHQQTKKCFSRCASCVPKMVMTSVLFMLKRLI